MSNGRLDSVTVLISSEKGLCARALNLDYYIDDKWENCVDVGMESNTKVYLLDRPWNQSEYNVIGGFVDYRVNTVGEFWEAIHATQE
jgi:uncharacterized HAD superfamily protein